MAQAVYNNAILKKWIVSLSVTLWTPTDLMAKFKSSKFKQNSNSVNIHIYFLQRGKHIGGKIREQ
jgi:hypothetical protein